MSYDEIGHPPSRVSVLSEFYNTKLYLLVFKIIIICYCNGFYNSYGCCVSKVSVVFFINNKLRYKLGFNK